MLRQFFACHRPHRRLFALDFGCAIASGLLALAFPVAVRAFVDHLLPGRDWASSCSPRLACSACT